MARRFRLARRLVDRFLHEARAAVEGWYSAHVIEIHDALLLADGRPVLVLSPIADGTDFDAPTVPDEPEEAPAGVPLPSPTPPSAARAEPLPVVARAASAGERSPVGSHLAEVQPRGRRFASGLFWLLLAALVTLVGALLGLTIALS